MKEKLMKFYPSQWDWLEKNRGALTMTVFIRNIIDEYIQRKEYEKGIIEGKRRNKKGW